MNPGQPPPESKRAALQEAQSGEQDRPWLTVASFGAVVYAIGCCAVLPFFFGSWAAFTAAAWLGAPLWLLLLLGGLGTAAGLGYWGMQA